MHWRLDGDPADPAAPLLLALHGMGMDEDFFAQLLAPLDSLPMRFLVPRGPYPVEVRGEGRIGASWYSYDGDQDRFRAELLRTEAIVLDLLRAVERENHLHPRKRFLLGFSQGGYCGSFIAVRHPELFSGMIVSGARVKWEFLEQEMRSAGALGFRALLCHGIRDPSVSIEAAEKSAEALGDAGIQVRLVKLDSGHSFGRTQSAEIGNWLQSLAFGASGSESAHR